MNEADDTLKDTRLASATAHWSHRFVTNGVPLADFQDVTGSLQTWDGWCAAWVDRGHIHNALAQQASQVGHMRSAGRSLEHRRRLLSFRKVSVRA